MALLLPSDVYILSEENCWQNMWDLTPDTDLLKELPEEYTFETTLADLIVISVKCQPSGVGLGLVVIGLSFGVLPFKAIGMMGGMGGMMGGTGGDMGDDLDDSDNEVEMAELSQILVAPDVSGCAQFRPLEFYSTISDLQVDHIRLTRVCSETVGGLPVLSVGKVSTCPVLSSPIFHIILGIKMYSDSGVLAEKASLIVFLMSRWGPPNLDSLVNAMKTFVPHVVMKNKNIIPQSGSALVPSLHAEELRADGKFKAVSI
ncbi:hypothetical protein FXO38_02648 [Capsicum annuum]|nr:hypothetical protein FXO38_02648 [Capsicum annuum]